MSATVLNGLVAALDSALQHDGNVVESPVALLWPDKDRQWEPVLPVLRERLPHLLTLGAYAANCKTGPAERLDDGIQDSHRQNHGRAVILSWICAGREHRHTM